MAIIKCKMCGGDIELSEDKTIGTCDSCGSKITLPKIDDEQRAAAFNRGNHFRRIGEFDKALAVYERIVQENDSDAEAHWCCALCRFGIEYVEDPTTYEWLPTCHRASFDSFLEDVDYLAAVEHSDGMTRRQYRREAERIAEIQRSILATSQNEQPFDVFICYKESDENGDRTRDSAIAQDIYYQLTEQGFRVFFARITLEDKVGSQYEPYIFAALNSAKVMIVVGTKPEYVNAVWVKNEWSRFLAFMKRDRSKLLLPCYRDMDPYDLPEQLSVLQAYDMSKIGFIQDLIRGVSKVLGKDKKPEHVRETVVVQSEGGTNNDALLKRGRIALEDGEWENADGYFDRVLDSDAECAEAYAGKFLAAKHCSTLNEYVERVLKSLEQIAPIPLVAVKEDTVRISKSVSGYSVPGYLEKDTIQSLYAYDRQYLSTLRELETRCVQYTQKFEKDKLMSRALKYMKGSYKSELESVHVRLLDAMGSILSQSHKQDEERISSIAAAYTKHLDDTDRKVEKLYQSAVERQRADEADRLENAYQSACELQNTATLPGQYEQAGLAFKELAEYLDSTERAQICYKLAKKKRKQKTRTKIIGICAVAAAIVAVILVTQVVIPSSHYRAAEQALSKGDYSTAIAEFEAAGNWQDASGRMYYQKAELSLADGNLAQAAIYFGGAGSYLDAQKRSFALWDQVAARNSVATGYCRKVLEKRNVYGTYHDIEETAFTVAVKSDGTVVATGSNNSGQCNVTSWSDIIAITTGSEHTIGLKANGTVVSAGSNADNRRNVSNWRNIVAISAGAEHTVGLKADGTVVAVGNNEYGQCNVSEWQDIVAISASSEHTLGLRADGVVVVTTHPTKRNQYDISGWSNIIAIAAGDDYVVGLKSDGTVVAVGNDALINTSGLKVSDWTNIVAIAAGTHTIGIKSDGSVVVAGYSTDTATNLGYWNNIVDIAVNNHGLKHISVGVQSNGRLLAIGDNEFGQCNANGWDRILVQHAK